MKRSLRPLAFVALLLSMSAAASAAPAPYRIDPAHSEVSFRVRHFFSKTPGWFTKFSGEVQFDDKSLEASSVNVTIETASINTNHERRDTHLKSPDFFAADSFPTLVFKSTKVEPATGSNFKIHGDLTMRGVTRPVTLDAELVGTGSVGQMGTRAGFHATTKINRMDYGIKWNKTLDNGGLMLDDVVDVDLSVEAIKIEPKKDEAKQPTPGDKK